MQQSPKVAKEIIQTNQKVIINPPAVVISTFDKNRLKLVPSVKEIGKLQQQILKHEVQMIGDARKYTNPRDAKGSSQVFIPSSCSSEYDIRSTSPQMTTEVAVLSTKYILP